MRTEGEDRENVAYHHRPAVAKEDGRRVVVVSEKPEKPACKREVEGCLARMPCEEKTACHAHGGDDAKACRKAVHAVDQIKRVDGADYPAHGQDAVHPHWQLRPEVGEAEVHPPPREECDNDLRRELHLRPERKLVVCVAHRGDDRGEEAYAHEVACRPAWKL